MDFKQRFNGRQGFITKQGNILDSKHNELIILQRGSSNDREKLPLNNNSTS